MRRSGVGRRPVQGGRTERLRLGRGPRVRRPPGDGRGGKKKRERSSVRWIGQEPGTRSRRCGTAPIMPHPSTAPLRRRPCFFLKIPRQGSGGVYLPTRSCNQPCSSVFQALKYSKPPTLETKLNSCSTTASESSAFVGRRLVSPLSLLSSKLLCSFLFQPTGSV